MKHWIQGLAIVAGLIVLNALPTFLVAITPAWLQTVIAVVLLGVAPTAAFLAVAFLVSKNIKVGN